MAYRTSPYCLYCKHRTMEKNLKLKAVIPGCDVKKCRFEERRTDDERTNETAVRTAERHII